MSALCRHEWRVEGEAGRSVYMNSSIEETHLWIRCEKCRANRAVRTTMENAERRLRDDPWRLARIVAAQEASAR